MADPWFRSTDMLRWGPATSGGRLTVTKFDENSWFMLERIRAVEAAIAASEIAGIDDITIVGSDLVFTMSDYSTFTVTIPIAYPNPRGEWQPSTIYTFNDWITYGGVLYMVMIDHTSDTTFDPNFVVGSTNAYLELVSSPSNVIPAGGATGTVLAKISGTDYATAWIDLASTFSMDNLSDVDLGTSPSIGQILQWEGSFWTLGDFTGENLTVLDSSGAEESLQDFLDDIGTNKVDFAYVDGSIATLETTVADNLAASEVTTAANLTAATIGKHDFWISANQFTPRTTNGAASNTAETTSNKNMIRTLDFDAATQEFAQYDWTPPKSWNLGTIQFTTYWSHAATTVNFGVAWAVDAVARSNADAIDVAFGTAVVMVDTGGTTDTMYVGPQSSAVTIAGTPALGDTVMIRVHRDPANGSDNMAIDARLHGLKITYTATAAIDD